jgi:nucleoporin GLE1
MNTAASFSSSFMDGGSPSRQSPNRKSSHKPRGSIVRDPYDSPGRQLAIEFNLRLSLSDRDFNERLDQAAAERARLHEEQLARAAEEHRKVLESAELEVQRITLEEEQAQARRLEAQHQEIERLRREKAQQEAEAQRRALEAKQREAEAARQAQEHQRQLEAAEARIKAQQEQEAAAERQKKEKEESDRRAKEAQDAAEKVRAQQVQQAQAPQPTQAASTTAAPVPATTSTPPSSSSQATAANVNQIHAKYLELHKRMKQFRIAFANEHKQKNNPLKEKVGDTRRNIRLRLGQINTDRKASVAAIKRLREDSFNIALSTPGPMIDIRPYIVSHEIPPLASEEEAQYPAFLLYMWICFEKSVLKQFDKEAAGSEGGRTIQEIGLIAASLLADQRYMWKGIPLTDIVLAKLHRTCPILFGIHGRMDTAEGRIRLGWIKSGETEGDYAQRMRGFGAGFAALSLRSFNAKAPAVPMSDYWRAIASICNTPTNDLWPGHFSLIHGLTKEYYKKFLAFYGAPARGVLRRATVDLPARAPPRCKDAAGTVAVLPLGWEKEGINLR